MSECNSVDLKSIECSSAECNSIQCDECNSVERSSAECNSIEETYYQRNKDVILKRVKDYYENGEKRLRYQARDKYANLCKEKKNKKREFGRKRYRNMSKEVKQKLEEYQKNYLEAKNSQSNQ